jgi:threonine synthase
MSSARRCSSIGAAATIAGLKHLLAEGIDAKDEWVACVLTGPTLKDANATVNDHKDRQGPFRNPPWRPRTTSTGLSS